MIGKWLECYHISLEKFDLVSRDTLSAAQSIFDPQSSHMRIHKPYWRLSPQTHRALDVSSYHYLFIKDNLNRIVFKGTQVDSEVNLLSMKNNSMKRLLFGGSQTVFDDAFWLDDNHIIVVGGEWLYRFVPEIWLIDLQNKTIQFYMYITVLPRYPKCNYKKIKFPDVIFTSK